MFLYTQMQIKHEHLCVIYDIVENFGLFFYKGYNITQDYWFECSGLTQNQDHKYELLVK